MYAKIPVRKLMNNNNLKFCDIMKNIFKYYTFTFSPLIFGLSVVALPLEKFNRFLHSYKILGKLKSNVRFSNVQNSENTMVLKMTIYWDPFTLSPSENVMPSTALFQVISGIGSPSASHISVTWPFSYVVSFLSCIMWGCTVKNIYITQSVWEENITIQTQKPQWALKFTLVQYRITNILTVTAAHFALKDCQETGKVQGEKL